MASAVRFGRSRRRPAAAAALIIAILTPGPGVKAATLMICRILDVASPLQDDIVVPAGSLFRDNGRADDPLAQFSGDVWQLRLETIIDVVMPPLRECVRVPVRITGDSATKSVASADNRTFVYSGSSDLLREAAPSETLLSLKGTVLDQVP